MVVDLAVVQFQAVRAAILVRLWVKTPCPVQVLAPSRLSRAGAVPAVSAFEGADPAFASGSPFDGSAERSAFLDLLAGGTGPALARYDDSADPELGQCLVGGGVAVPAVGGHGAWYPPGPGLTRWIAGANCGASAGFPACIW